MMIVILGVTALVVGAIASLATGSWWFFILALGVHAVGTLVVVGYTYSKAAEDEDKPDPVTEARIEEERSEVRT